MSECVNGAGGPTPAPAPVCGNMQGVFQPVPLAGSRLSEC